MRESKRQEERERGDAGGGVGGVVLDRRTSSFCLHKLYVLKMHFPFLDATLLKSLSRTTSTNTLCMRVKQTCLPPARLLCLSV